MSPTGMSRAASVLFDPDAPKRPERRGRRPRWRLRRRGWRRCRLPTAACADAEAGARACRLTANRGAARSRRRAPATAGRRPRRRTAITVASSASVLRDSAGVGADEAARRRSTADRGACRPSRYSACRRSPAPARPRRGTGAGGSAGCRAPQRKGARRDRHERPRRRRTAPPGWSARPGAPRDMPT